MENEIIWRRMIYNGEDLGDFYMVSNTGEIKGVKTGKIRSKNINHEGYYFTSISLGSRENKRTIKNHRAVAETFLDNPNNYPVINHIDANKLNNNVENLEFCTYRDNTIHALKNNLLKFNPIKIKVKTTNGEIYFNSITEAGAFFNKENPNSGRSNISRALLENGTAYGYKWTYV